jgi:hypothetical protein
LQVPKLHQKCNKIFKMCSTWSHSKMLARLWVMNFLFLILWKIINLTRLEVFDFRQLEHLLEILCYHWWVFDSRKVQQRWVLAWFCRFGASMAKTSQTLATSFFLQLCKFPNFTKSAPRYLKGAPLDLTQKCWLVCELWIFSF